MAAKKSKVVLIARSISAILRQPISILFVLMLGSGLIWYSTKMEEYRDPAYFEKEYSKLKHGDSEKYFKLRDGLITNKNKYHDYGISAIIISVILFAGRFKALITTGPKTRTRLFLIGLFIPLLTVSGYTFDLVQGLARGEFPHWADSLGIPLLGVPFMLVLFLGFTSLLYYSVHKTFVSNSELSDIFKKGRDRGFVLISGIATIFVMDGIVFGQYWYWVPSCVWLYFFLSVGSMPKLIEPEDTEKPFSLGLKNRDF